MGHRLKLLSLSTWLWCYRCDCYRWIQLCVSCCDRSKCLLCNHFTNLMGADSLASLYSIRQMGRTRPQHVNKDKIVSVSTNLCPKPLPSSSFANTLGLSPVVCTCRSDTRLHIIVGVWSKSPLRMRNITFTHIILYHCNQVITFIILLTDKRHLSHSHEVIKHKEAVLSFNNSVLLPFIPAYQGNWFMLFTSSGTQNLVTENKIPLGILFDLIFLRIGSEFLSPSLLHHTAHNGIVPDCCWTTLNTSCSFTVGASNKRSVWNRMRG